jgi:hypothetical protein
MRKDKLLVNMNIFILKEIIYIVKILAKPITSSIKFRLVFFNSLKYLFMIYGLQNFKKSTF